MRHVAKKLKGIWHNLKTLHTFFISFLVAFIVYKMFKPVLQVALNIPPNNNILSIQIETGKKRKCQVDIKTVSPIPKKPRHN